MFKNVANQKVAVFAWDNAPGEAKTGDAANITAQISIDGAATAATNDVNPTELDSTDAPGIYIFDMTQAETNGDLIVISPVSATSDIVLRPVIIYTQTAVAGIADAVWDEASAGHTAAGSMGLALGSLYSTIVVRVAQCGDAGSATTIDLDASASGTNDFYKGQLIAIVLGTGAGQARTCTGYDGATKIATVTPAWALNPDGNSYFAILNTGSTVVVDWADGGRLDLILDAIKVVTDALTEAAATKMALSAGTIITGTVSHDNTAATRTVFYCDDITEATADHFKSRIIIFTSGALQYQATDIVNYELSAGEGKFTVGLLTEAPADNTTFIII